MVPSKETKSLERAFLPKYSVTVMPMLHFIQISELRENERYILE